MKPSLHILLVAVLFAAFSPSRASAQTPPDEPDTAAFIQSTFQLQDRYSRVLCVSNANPCPSEITAAVPCLSADCHHDAQTYAVAETYSEIQPAAESAQAGDLIAIMSGRYAGVMLEETGGEDGAYIHFLGMGDVVIDQVADPSRSWLRHLFYFINTHHYIIQNITFANSRSGAGIFFSGYFSETGAFSHHMIVLDVYSHDNYEWGMHTTATNQMLIQDSVFTNSVDEHGLYVSGSGDDIVIRRNVFQGNNAAGVQVNADPQTATWELYTWLQNVGDTCGIDDGDVDGTEWQDIKACYDQQGLPQLGAYIEDGISQNIIIEGNIITGNGSAGGAGINLASVRKTIVRNNLIYGNNAAGIACWDNGYAEEKGLAVSPFGCQDVLIANNTIVDERGRRGALILARDAQNMRVYNNIIVRDRFDAYEVTENSGTGLRSGNNYYFAQSITDSSGFNGDENSITGFTIPEALAQFVKPTFEAWIVPNGDSYSLNPDRPDFHLRADSQLAVSGDSTLAPTYDLLGQARQNEIGAFATAT